MYTKLKLYNIPSNLILEFHEHKQIINKLSYAIVNQIKNILHNGSPIITSTKDNDVFNLGTDFYIDSGINTIDIEISHNPNINQVSGAYINRLLHLSISIVNLDFEDIIGKIKSVLAHELTHLKQDKDFRLTSHHSYDPRNMKVKLDIINNGELITATVPLFRINKFANLALVTPNNESNIYNSTREYFMSFQEQEAFAEEILRLFRLKQNRDDINTIIFNIFMKEFCITYVNNLLRRLSQTIQYYKNKYTDKLLVSFLKESILSGKEYAVKTITLFKEVISKVINYLRAKLKTYLESKYGYNEQKLNMLIDNSELSHNLSILDQVYTQFMSKVGSVQTPVKKKRMLEID